MPDHAVPLGAFAKAVGLTARHVRRLIAAGLPVAVANGARGPCIPLAAGRAWIAKARRARTGGPAVAGRLALLNVQTAGSRSRERTHRTRYVHESDWAPAWRAEIAAVRAVLDEWRGTAPARILEILRPGGPRLFPGEDPRAIGYAIAAHVAEPLLHELADRVGELPALPGAGVPRRPPRLAPTILDAKRRLVEARTAELALRIAVTSDPGWRPRGAVQAALREAIAAARAEVSTGLPGQCVRLLGGPLTPLAITAAVASCVQHVLAALARPLATGPVTPSADEQNGHHPPTSPTPRVGDRRTP